MNCIFIIIIIIIQSKANKDLNKATKDYASFCCFKFLKR